jgi:hypothetical protein
MTCAQLSVRVGVKLFVTVCDILTVVLVYRTIFFL